MFSLIISIIAIALVAALAGASVYYGGTAFSKGTSDAEASKFKSNGLQVAGAVTLAKAAGDWDATKVLADITPSYLAELPDGLSEITAGDAYVTADVSVDACVNIAGVDVVGDLDAAVADDAAVVAAATDLFGCMPNTADGHTAFYRM